MDGLQEPTADSSSQEIQPSFAQDREGGDALRDSLLEELQSQLQVGEDGEEPPSNLDKSGEKEYLMLQREKERLLEKNPVASRRTQEQKAQLKKIYNRLRKLSKQTDCEKRKAVTAEANSEERGEGRDLLSAQNGGNECQPEGHKMKR